MARELKVFSLGNGGFIDTATQETLELPSHVRQAQVLAIAATKAAAVQVLAERGFRRVSARDPEFRQAMGNDVDALRDAGLFDEPRVLVTPLIARDGDPVAVMLLDGVPQRIGRLHSKPPRYVYVFEPEEA